MSVKIKIGSRSWSVLTKLLNVALQTLRPFFFILVFKIQFEILQFSINVIFQSLIFQILISFRASCLRHLTLLHEINHWTWCTVESFLFHSRHTILFTLSGQDGRNAAAQYVLDRGSVLEEGRRYSVRVPKNLDVHIRLCLLSQEKQSERNLRSKLNQHYIYSWEWVLKIRIASL